MREVLGEERGRLQPPTLSVDDPHRPGVEVDRGDLVLGDNDGVVIIPASLGAEGIGLAEEKVSGENLVRAKLAEGMPVSEAFRTYGVI